MAKADGIDGQRTNPHGAGPRRPYAAPALTPESLRGATQHKTSLAEEHSLDGPAS